MRTFPVCLAVAALILLTAGVWAAGPERRITLPDIPNPKVAVDAPEIGRYGGTLVDAQVSEPRTFNPVIVTDASTGRVLGPIFEGLVESNYLTGEIEPALAESWTLSGDHRTWTFTLRQGVRWSDGRPLTIDDVLFSLQTVFTKGVQSTTVDLLTFGGRPVRWRRVDDRRIAFVSDEPLGFFLRLLQDLVIIPRHKLQAALAGGGETFNAAWAVNTPPREIVGTGPFIMQSYVFGQRVTYGRNPRYWRVDRAGGRLPYLDRVVLQIVPNVDAEKLKFLSGEIDLYNARPREYAEFKRGERAGNYTIYDGPETFSSEYLVFNQNPRGIQPPKRTWFQDVRFRRALNHAIDRETIVRQVYAGRATPAWSPVSIANRRYYHPNLPRYPYDLARAQRLLEEAGYRKGADGLLRDAAGAVVEFVLSTSAQSPDGVAIGNIVRQDFARLGIRVLFAPEPFSTLVTKLDNTFTWDAIIIGLTGDVEPGTARTYWMSSGSLHDWNPRQARPATAWEAEIDRIFEQVAREVDPDRRRALYWRWQEIVAEQVPVMFFTNPKTQPVVRNTLGNTRLGLQGATGRLEWRYYRTGSR
ncbi:MAG: ABC transporter substrate-binding protein [Armatimonadota bacterium]|nr:ABC transporter substrate-binding protein [Armatimonadota bacterium]MDR7549892.1 ABC transporter substrate-binding protein [Armatimonadota bacterium]